MTNLRRYIRMGVAAINSRPYIRMGFETMRFQLKERFPSAAFDYMDIFLQRHEIDSQCDQISKTHERR